MVMLQIDLSNEENEIVEIFKVKKKLVTKEDAVKDIIKNAKECNHKFEVISNENRLIHRITQRCIYCGIIRMDKIYSSGTIETSFAKK